MQNLRNEGVLKIFRATEHANPTFIIAEKDGRVICVSDFHELNQQLRLKIYSLPRIQDILQRQTGYKYFKKIDISMKYYKFELVEESSSFCIIITPFVKYRYK